MLTVTVESLTGVPSDRERIVMNNAIISRSHRSLIAALAAVALAAAALAVTLAPGPARGPT